MKATQRTLGGIEYKIARKYKTEKMSVPRKKSKQKKREGSKKDGRKWKDERRKAGRKKNYVGRNEEKS